MTESALAVSETSTAPKDLSIATSHPYTDELLIDWGSVNTIDSTLDKLLADAMKGCGQVFLHSIYVKITASAANQKFSCGVTEAGSGFSLAQVAGMKSGFKYVSTTYNCGNQKEITIVPTDRTSLQIRPVSSALPMLRFVASKSEGMDVDLIFYITVMGVRVRSVSLKV